MAASLSKQALEIALLKMKDKCDLTFSTKEECDRLEEIIKSKASKTDQERTHRLVIWTLRLFIGVLCALAGGGTLNYLGYSKMETRVAVLEERIARIQKSDQELKLILLKIENLLQEERIR